MNTVRHDLALFVCKMRCACAPADAALTALAGGLGVAARPTVTVNPFAAGGAFRTADSSGVRWSF